MSAGVGSAVGTAVGDSAWGSAMGGFGARLAGGIAGGAVATALTGGNRRSYETVFLSSLGSAIGESFASPGVDWRNAPDESAAESARLDRSGNRYAAWPDQTDAETARLARSGNPYAAWPDQTDAETARLGRYENRARFMEGMERDWAKQDAAASALALRRQHANADAYRVQLAREAFNFGDGRDARDIRLSFGYQSRVSRELSDLAPASGVGRYGSPGGFGDIRPTSPVEGFFTFNPVGRTLKGWGNAATAILKSPYTAVREATFMAGDAVGNLTYGGMNWALGGSQVYQNDSVLGQSLRTNGILGTTGLAITGTVRSLPGIAQVDAINRRDWEMLGASGPTTLLAGIGWEFSNVKGPLQTGGRQVLNPGRIEGWDAAERVYGVIRADQSDIAAIAQNTGMPEATISRIKAHVFENEHMLDSGLRRFDADPNIVNAWSRLKQGDFLQSDLVLLSHERFESKFEALFRTNYRTAHDAAEKSGRVWKPE